MPRKVKYGVDYDEDYDDYDDYDYDYDIEEKEEAPHSKQEVITPGVWSCRICTYDNDESMSACDICGVLRNPVANKHTNDEKRNAPFKFDVPSPDDVVSNGLWASKMVSKANSSDFKLSKVSSTVIEKNVEVNVQSSAKRSESSHVFTPKDRQDTMDKSNTLPNSRFSDSSSASVLNSKLDNVHESNAAVSIQSSEKSSFSLMPNVTHALVDGDSCSSRNAGEGHSFTSNLNSMSLTVKSGNLSEIRAPKVNSQAKYKPEKWMLPEKAEDILTQLNLAIVGHVDSGKSTLSGRLLHLFGRISQKEMHKYEKDAKLQGKGSFAYAWALDESSEERERGITMTVAVAYFDSKRYHVVILDSPGHKDFVPNMISGATQADAAILVIDASIGSFEAGMDAKKGQTREHAQLIRSFGVDQIIVAVNKMDAVEYSKDRFDLIKSQLGAFLRSCNFKDSCISWVALSAMENQNLVATPSDARLSS